MAKRERQDGDESHPKQGPNRRGITFEHFDQGPNLALTVLFFSHAVDGRVSVWHACDGGTLNPTPYTLLEP